MTAPRSNPILQALQALSQGQPLDRLLAMRDEALPTPQSWLEQGWEALASLDETSFEADCLVQLMAQAWIASGQSRQANRPWLGAEPMGAQGLWLRCHAKFSEET